MEVNKTSLYKINLGNKLRSLRIEKLYTIDDIVYMTEISRSTIIKIEKGEAKIIDYYVEYAKAVQYPLETLVDLNIPLIPLNQLPKDRLESLKLTSKIREHIVNTNFLNEGKIVAEIKEELVRLKLVPKDITSVAIAGVMRNLKNDELVSSEETTGRKAIYIKPKK
ncbi:helix-turn-helix transcriptional regulator [Empedobacter tilapiae]